MDLALSNLRRLICHKTQPTNQPTNKQNQMIIYICIYHLWVNSLLVILFLNELELIFF